MNFRGRVLPLALERMVSMIVRRFLAPLMLAVLADAPAWPRLGRREGADFTLQATLGGTSLRSTWPTR